MVGTGRLVRIRKKLLRASGRIKKSPPNSKNDPLCQGLNAEQLQLIEKLLKESKGGNNNNNNGTAAADAGTAGSESATAATAAAALAAVQSPPKGPLINKPAQTADQQVLRVQGFFCTIFHQPKPMDFLTS